MATGLLAELKVAAAGFSSCLHALQRRLKGPSTPETNRLAKDLQRLSGMIPALSSEIETRYEKSGEVLQPLAEAS